MTRFRIRAAGLLAAGLVALAGCGGGSTTAEVTGTVSFEGKPVEKGAITFRATDGKGGTSGGEILNGKYTVLAPLGPTKVEINGTKVVGKKKIYNTPDSPTMDVAEELLPKKYNEKTELTFDVKPGKNEKDFPLTK